MSRAEPLVFSGTAIGAGTGHLIGLGRSGFWICALGLVICLCGCQPRSGQAPPLPPPPAPTAAPQPRPARPTFYVTVNRLSLRTCPGTDCPKTTSLELNAEVEKMGESQNWTQIKVKKDGTIGYVSSRYLASQPVKAAKPARKKPKKVQSRKAAPPPETPEAEEETGSKKQEPSPPLPRVM